MPVLDAGRARRLATAAGQTAIQMSLRCACGLRTLQDLFDLVDAASGAVQLIAQDLVRRAGREAEPAMDASAQDLVRARARRGLPNPLRESCFHQCVLRGFMWSQPPKQSAAIEDA